MNGRGGRSTSHAKEANSDPKKQKQSVIDL